MWAVSFYIIGIRILPRSVRNSSLFSVTYKISPFVKGVSVTNLFPKMATQLGNALPH